MATLKKTPKKASSAKGVNTRRSAPKKPSAPRLTGKQVLAWLTSHPTFFEDFKNDLGALMLPKKGGNIISLHAAKADKVTEENDRLKVRHKQMVALASHNVAMADSLFEAMVSLVGVKTPADLSKFVQGDMRRVLEVPMAKVYKLGAADT
ncbi:MAG: hypothetical protein COY40_02375, partial [Alphaproteobacteria bacterium CG_4_10_14_0_8_um_filter_53_9]